MANSTLCFASDGPRNRARLIADDQALRRVLNESIRRSGLSRDQVADRMSSILGQQITPSIVNGWCAPNRQVSRMPAALIPAFAQATGSDLIIRFVMGRSLADLLKLGELVSRVVPSALSKLEKSRSCVSKDQELLFG